MQAEFNVSGFRQYSNNSTVITILRVLASIFHSNTYTVLL